MKRERGRPYATTHDEIVAAAFELFREIGFADTTMTMIARRAGIGRSTLSRYFPNRAAILWHTHAEITEATRRHLAAQPAEMELVDAAFAAYLTTWRERPEPEDVRRESVRTIETSPAELTGKWAGYATAQQHFHEFVLARTGRPQNDTAALVAAHAIWAAIWAASTSYALDGDEPLEAHLARARATLDIQLPTH